MYQNHPGRQSVTDAAVVVASSIFQSSNTSSASDKIYRVLEVGSGTGSMSLELCQELQKCWGDRFELYFTDISAAFFVKAEKKLEEFQENVKYAVFNIEENPLGQGIPLQYFDCVMATDVIHATRDLQESLVHLRQTLKPEGALVFSETISESREITFLFGLLEGYWRYEDFNWRPHHTCVGTTTWTDVMERSGFQDVSAFKVYNDEFAIIMGSADPSLGVETIPAKLRINGAEKKKWIVFTNEDWADTATGLVKVLQTSGYEAILIMKKKTQIVNQHGIQIERKFRDPADFWSTIGVRCPDDANPVHGIIYGWGITEDEIDQTQVALPLLHILKSVVDQTKPPQVFVLTKGLRPVNDDSHITNPSGATLLGMLKSLKNENWNVFTRCIEFDSESTRDAILSQLLYELVMTKGKELHRVQVAYRNGIRYEPRFVKSFVSEGALSLPPSTDRYHLILPKSKAIKDLVFDSEEQRELGENQVEVKVSAYALNFRDIFAILKPSAKFDSINGVGIDFSGEISRVGSAVNKFKVGDKVNGANYGDEHQFSSHVVADSKLLYHVPERLTLWEAATIPAVYSTVLYSFMEVTQIKKDDTVLIHTGSGGVGLAAIQVAKHFGAKIITTAGNPRKRAYLRSLGLEHVFHSRNISYKDDIKRVTNGRGVDLVLNSITGPGFKEATLRCCAEGARFIEMSKLSVWTPEEVKVLRPDVEYTIIDVTTLNDGELERLNARSEALTAKEVIQPIPFVKFDAVDIRNALQYFQKAKHIGKVVCVMPEVKTEQRQYKVTVPLFNNRSTYWITGALGGGIGFEVCKWMLTLGATDIILSGRNPPKLGVATEIEKMNKAGFNVMVKLGDIGNFDNCKIIMQSVDKRKPLRGVMHCAGVLRDNLYRNQTWEDFEATFTPKVAGTWNLHNLTRNMQLEHFVMFSSLTALVGTPSQPNHAAANSFEDAFIHYRYSLGLPGTSINWGQWAQVGVAKEISLTGIRPVSLKRMMSGLEETMRTQKRQVCYSDFDSFKACSILLPIVSTYVDERLLNQESANDSTPVHGLNADEFWKEMDAGTKEEKVEIMSKYLKILLRTTLRLGSGEAIGDHTNVQDLGVDSLMMIELKNSIQTLLGSRLVLTAATIKNCNTVHLISTAIVTKLLDEEQDEEVDEPLDKVSLRALLMEDSILPQDILPASPPLGVSKARGVLVTGATGRLAPYVVVQLINNFPTIEKIACLVRNVADSNAAMEKLKNNMKSYNIDISMEKVECIAGNVSHDNLGLSDKSWKELSASVDVIIHCAATSNQSEYYKKSSKSNNARSVNVEGTKNIIKFAVEQKTKFIYFASNLLNGMMSATEQETLPDTWPVQEAIDGIIEHKMPGLQTSKLICELLLKQAVDRGIPCKIFRFPWIAGDSHTGCLNPIDNLYILRYLSFVKVKAMPSLALPATPIPADICARLSLQLFFNDETPNEVFNITHPQPPIEQEFVSVAKEELGIDIEILELTEFLKRMSEEDKQNGDSAMSRNMNVGHELFLKSMSEIAVVLKGFIASPETFFQNEKVRRYLPNYGKEIPPGMDVVRRDVKYLKSTGLLQQFGL